MGHTLLAPILPSRLGLAVSSLVIVCAATTAAQLFGLSEEEEIALSREAAAEIERALTLLEDETANDYVSDLGQTLARRSGRPERLDATRERQPNTVERFFASHPEPAERAANIADMLDPQSAGEWFFDPAGTVKRHFRLGDAFSTTYLHQPFVGIFRDANR